MKSVIITLCPNFYRWYCRAQRWRRQYQQWKQERQELRVQLHRLNRWTLPRAEEAAQIEAQSEVIRRQIQDLYRNCKRGV